MDLMWQAAATAGSDWRNYFVPENFTKGMSSRRPPKFEHGVSMAEGKMYGLPDMLFY